MRQVYVHVHIRLLNERQSKEYSSLTEEERIFQFVQAMIIFLQK